jgi:hypothetical protein
MLLYRDLRHPRRYVRLVGCPIRQADVTEGVSVDISDIRECCTTDVHSESSRETVLMRNNTYFVQHLKVRHVLDVMHCEKNLCENIVKTLFGMNDSPGSRQDVEDLNIREELWLQPPRRHGDEFYMPRAPYILKPEERKQFVQIVSNIRTPTKYVGAIHKRLVDGKLQYMKTHDYHVLMQQVLH